MTDSPTQAAPPASVFCWNELMTTDAAAARDFYTKLFGWTTEEKPMGEFTYTILKSGDTQVGGLMQMEGDCFKGIPSHWMSYVSVEDVDASARKAKDLGATICVEPTDIPEVGRFAVVTDPTGAAIALFSCCPG